jgi:lipopolysaccharide/colanic/teichoic acid biosynthesis glycosyltransferase
MAPKVINKPRVIPNRRGYRIAKRAMDLIICVLALPVVLPLSALLAVWIRLD